MRRHLPRLLLIAACGLVGASCDDVDLLLCDDDDISCANSWEYSETLRDAGSTITCRAAGGANNQLSRLDDVNGDLVGEIVRSGTCTSPGGATVYTEASDLHLGTISGRDLTFRTPQCDFEGTTEGSPPDTIRGTAVCEIAIDSQTVTVSGPWLAVADFVRD